MFFCEYWEKQEKVTYEVEQSKKLRSESCTDHVQNKLKAGYDYFAALTHMQAARNHK
jgi:hypothetical protein